MEELKFYLYIITMKFIASIILTLFCIAAHASSHLENIDQEGSLSFTIIGKPSLIEIKGTSPAPKTQIEINHKKLTVFSELNLSELKTGIAVRDEHMQKKYLQTELFPKAILKIEKILSFDYESRKLDIKNEAFVGTLFLHGKEKLIKGTFNFSKQFELTSTFRISLADFGYDVPEYAGIVVADTVIINTKLQFIKRCK
jgi:polyisoprenoid-binding protein YceI